MIKNVFFIACTVIIILLIPFFLSHDSPIPVHIVQLDAQEIAAQKEASAQAEKQAQHQARIQRIYSCKTDADCIIVDKDPCGCAVGPKGVVSINVNYIVDFNNLNNRQSVTTSCSEKLSKEKECSPSARAICKANRCSIHY